jgi:hypothetical protein
MLSTFGVWSLGVVIGMVVGAGVYPWFAYMDRQFSRQARQARRSRLDTITENK